MDVIISAKARRQLRRLESYLAERFYPRNAERFINRLIDACEAIGPAPYLGTRRDDLLPGVRSTGFEHIVTIYFEVIHNELRILTITYRGKLPRKNDLKFEDPRL